jgi:hypothetical protein
MYCTVVGRIEIIVGIIFFAYPIAEPFFGVQNELGKSYSNINIVYINRVMVDCNIFDNALRVKYKVVLDANE